MFLRIVFSINYSGKLSATEKSYRTLPLRLGDRDMGGNALKSISFEPKREKAESRTET